MTIERVTMTGLCMNCGQRITFCGRPFTAEVRCSKCNAINQFENSQQPIKFRFQREPEVTAATQVNELPANLRRTE